MKPVGLVPEFCGIISIKNSATLDTYFGRYIEISRASRICHTLIG
jgi:hypothetical protein